MKTKTKNGIIHFHGTNIKFLLLVLISILLVSFTSAYDFGYNHLNLGTFKQNDCVRVVQTCGDVTYINISSISYPNSSTAVSNVAMTYSGGEYYYNFCNTSNLGRYDVRGFSDGCEGTFTTYFEVTTRGFNNTTGQSILYIGLLFFLACLFLISLYYATIIPWRNKAIDDGTVIGINELKYVKLFLIVACYILLVFLFGTLSSLAEAYLDINSLQGIFNVSYWVLFSFMWPVIVVSMLLAVTKFLTDKKLRKALERGIPIR